MQRWSSYRLHLRFIMMKNNDCSAAKTRHFSPAQSCASSNGHDLCHLWNQRRDTGRVLTDRIFQSDIQPGLHWRSGMWIRLNRQTIGFCIIRTVPVTPSAWSKTDFNLVDSVFLTKRGWPCFTGCYANSCGNEGPGGWCFWLSLFLCMWTILEEPFCAHESAIKTPWMYFTLAAGILMLICCIIFLHHLAHSCCIIRT